MKRVGKKPFKLLDQEAIRAACCKHVAEKPPAKLKQLMAKKKPKTYISLAKVTINCGYNVSKHNKLLNYVLNIQFSRIQLIQHG